ncbi:MAG TPA: acyl-homoserine-lactone synthase [Rhizomicrobium sp.]|nr:acyl-homoserine-lactone synthase [Rhizomicrobium sp.]
MLEVVTSRNALLYQDALHDMYCLRHRMLVDGGGLERLRRKDGLLVDRFDGPDATYLLLTDDSGNVRGAERLLPTTGRHVLAEIVPEACSVAGVLRGKGIFELTRVCVDEALDLPVRETARNHLMVGLLEFCVRSGCRKLTMLLPTDALFHHLVIGLKIKPLGLPVERDGTKQIAVAMTIDQTGLDALRFAFDVFEPLVHYVGAPAGDPLSLVPALITDSPREAAE